MFHYNTDSSFKLLVLLECLPRFQDPEDLQWRSWEESQFKFEQNHELPLYPASLGKFFITTL